MGIKTKAVALEILFIVYNMRSFYSSYTNFDQHLFVMTTCMRLLEQIYFLPDFAVTI